MCPALAAAPLGCLILPPCGVRPRARYSVCAVKVEDHSNWGSFRVVADAQRSAHPTVAGDQMVAVPCTLPSCVQSHGQPERPLSGPALFLTGKQFLHRFFQRQQMSGSLNHQVQARAIIGRQAGVHEHWCGRRSQFDNMCHFDARHPGHAVVRYDHVMNPWIEQRESFCRVSDRFHRITEIGQKPLGRDAAFISVIN